MTNIKINAIDQNLDLIECPTLASGGMNEVSIEWIFDSYWNGFTPVACFFRNDDKKPYYAEITNNSCIIPSEVTSDRGLIFVGLIGTNESSIRTSEVIKLFIEKGAISKDIKPSEPTPDLYQLILNYYGELKLLFADFDSVVESEKIVLTALRDTVKNSEQNAKNSEVKAKASEEASKVSESNAKVSETKAKTSETAAKESADKAKASEDAAKVSETNSKVSETNSKNSEIKAKESASAAEEALSSMDMELFGENIEAEYEGE